MMTNQAEIRVYSGFCPDGECHSKLFFPSYAASSIECTGCGKHYHKDLLLQVELVKDPKEAFRNLLRSGLLTKSALKKGTDLVKVKGYSNYHCRLVSPLLTHYGMDNKTSEAKLLREMGQGDIFDCSHFGDRAFSIEEEYLDTPGYGRDRSGSIEYLREITEEIKIVNDDEERIVPLHVDGDGHCLVHAISRALVGREIFWHPLMVNLQEHLKQNITKYKALFLDFIGNDEWDLIISEAGPDFQPTDDQPLGLRNIHIFGLANVLHRPILLLDSKSGIQSSADYSGTFLPALVDNDLCRKKDGKPIPPLAIAWSNSGRNHYIPLVNIRNKPPAQIPSWIIPKAWGIPDEYLKEYIEFDINDVCAIGGSRTMSDAYLHRLMKAMDNKFLELNGVSASLVTEVHQFIFKPSGVVGVLPQTVIDRTRQRVQYKALMRCIACQAVSEYDCPVNQESAAHVEGGLAIGQMYSFPDQHSDNDVLKPTKYEGVDLTLCSLCKGPLRILKADGSPVYVNGDRTCTPVSGKTKCSCGFKHFWDGMEYDNLPEVFPVALEWGGKSIKENVYWFQHESDESLNSNVYEVAGRLVQNHFPGEFGSERLVQKVVDTILRQTARKEGENKGARPDIPNLPPCSSSEAEAVDAFIPSKIILTGQKKKTFHREELTQSETEKRIKIKTEHHAAITQHRQTKLQKSPVKSPPKQHQNKKPPTPSLQTPTSQRTDKKIRLTSSLGGQHDLTLPLNATFSQLQEAIHTELGVPPGDQKIRYGFPPRLLNHPEEGKEEEPIPIQHGDRVTVEVLPPPEPVAPQKIDVEMPEEKKMDIASAVGGEGSEGPEEECEEKKKDTPMDVDFDTSALASVLMSALSGNLGNDLWEAACRTPQMFENGGYYYNLVTNDLGPLVDDQHFAIRQLPNKLFAYNKDKDHIELCLGMTHTPVQPLNQETLTLAHNQQMKASGTSASQQSSSVINTEASFSGVISRNTGRTQKAFSGEGRSLSGSTNVSPRKLTEQTPSLQSLATITSDTQGPGTSTASNKVEAEQAMEEKPKRTDQSAEESPFVEGIKTSNNESLIVEEGSRIGKPIEDASMMEEKPAEEEKPGVTEKLVELSTVEEVHGEADRVGGKSFTGENSNQPHKPKRVSSMEQEIVQSDKPLDDSEMGEGSDEASKITEVSLVVQTPVQPDELSDEKVMGEESNEASKPTEVSLVVQTPVQPDELSDDKVMGEESNEASKPTEVSLMARTPVQPDKFADETVMGQESDETSKPMEESAMMEDPFQAGEPEETSTLMEKSTSTDKPAEEPSMAQHSDQTDKLTEASAAENIQTPKQTEECPMVEKDNVVLNIVSSTSTASLDMKGDKPSTLVKEEVDGGVVMETDHHGNGLETEDKQYSVQNESKGPLCTANEDNMDVDQLDQLESQSTDSSPVSQASTTGKPVLDKPRG